MNSPEPNPHPFALKDCALIAIATNKRAGTLKEFRDHIDSLSPDSLYHHFWANLAEELAVLDPVACDDLEDMRYQILERIDERLEESEYLQWYHPILR